MEKKKVLLLAADSKSRELLSRSLTEQSTDLAVEVSGRIHEVLTRLSAEHFDAAICCADTPDELAYVIRIKKKNPNTPVVVLSRVTEQGFSTLAESMGASAVVRKTAGLEATSKALALAIQTRALIKHQHEHYLRTKDLTRDVRMLARANRRLVEMALGMAACDERQFITLYVEDDSEQVKLMTRAFSRAKLPPFLRSVDSVENAMKYLAGEPPYADREIHPFPALVISDLNLPGKSGLELVEWMRERPETRLLGMIMMTSSEREVDIDDAYRRGANLYLVKKLQYTEIIEVVREVLAQFIAQKSGFRVP